MKKFTVILTGCLFLSGCAKLSHLQQLLTLKALADEQTQIGKYVDAQNANFDRMLEEAKASTLDDYASKKEIRAAFGEPVLVRAETMDDVRMDQWLYRHATEYFGGDKVYLYFDAKDRLVRSEYLEGAPDGQSEQETPAENGREEI